MSDVLATELSANSWAFSGSSWSTLCTCPSLVVEELP